MNKVKPVSVTVSEQTIETAFVAVGKNPDYIPKSGILERADATIHGEREDDYGNTRQNFIQIAMLFQGTLATKLQPDARITPEDVALLMMQVKIARLAKSPDHKDSILDIAGYAGCYDELQQQREWPTKLLGATVDPRKSE